MKVLFITYEGGSMPSIIKGGAVSTLVEHLINRNEKENKYELTVISAFEKLSYQSSLNYKNTKFIYINRNKFLSKFLLLCSKIVKKIFKEYFYNSNLAFLDYLIKIKKNINFSEYDKIIIENRPTYINFFKIKENNNVYLHLHNNYLSWKKKGNKELYKKYKGIYVVSNYIKKCTLSPKYSNDKIKVFYNCIDINLFNKELYQKNKENLRKKLNIENNDIVFVFSGRLTQEKGIKELIKAFSLLKFNNIKLLILGNYDYGKKDKNKFIKELEKEVNFLKEKIIFTGFIDRNDVPKYLAISDIAIVPSLLEEASGLTVMEAQASGLPLITTDIGGIPEIIDKGSSIMINVDENFINKLKEEMEFLYLNPLIRIQMGNNARKYIETYNLDFYWEQFNRLMEEK